MKTFKTVEDFNDFVMHYEGELVVQGIEIFENGVLIGRMEENGD